MDFDEMKKPPMQVGLWDSSRNAAAASAAGYSPQIEKGAPQTPWAPTMPSYMQPGAAQSQAVSPWAGGYTGDAQQAAPAGPNMSIPGAAQAAANGALPWQMQLMYGGY